MLKVVFTLMASGVVFVGCGKKTHSPPDQNTSLASNPAVDAPASAPPKPDAPRTNQIPAEPQAEELNQLVLRLTGRDMETGKIVTDKEGKPAIGMFPDGAKIIFQSSRPIALIATNGEQTAYNYDDNGNWLQTIHPDGRREAPANSPK